MAVNASQLVTARSALVSVVADGKVVVNGSSTADMDGLLQVPMSFCLSIGAVVACGIVMAYLLRRQLCTPECQSASLQVLEWQPATPCSVWHIAIAYLMQWRTATIRNLTSIDLDVSAVDNV